MNANDHNPYQPPETSVRSAAAGAERASGDRHGVPTLSEIGKGALHDVRTHPRMVVGLWLVSAVWSLPQNYTMVWLGPSPDPVQWSHELWNNGVALAGACLMCVVWSGQLRIALAMGAGETPSWRSYRDGLCDTGRLIVAGIAMLAPFLALALGPAIHPSFADPHGWEALFLLPLALAFMLLPWVVCLSMYWNFMLVSTDLGLGVAFLRSLSMVRRYFWKPVVLGALVASPFVFSDETRPLRNAAVDATSSVLELLLCSRLYLSMTRRDEASPHKHPSRLDLSPLLRSR